MPRAVVISSYVAFGGVGLRAALSAFGAAGVEVIALPTALLSNHPGHANVAGAPVSVAALESMMAALDANGALLEVDAVMTGYLPTTEHAAFARRAIDAIRVLNPDVIALVDPVMGDDPGGLYIDAGAAQEIALNLAPIADILTPNRFELAELSGMRVSDAQSAILAVQSLARPVVAVTSIPDASGRLTTIIVSEGGTDLVSAPCKLSIAHGAGDLFAALLLAGVLRGLSPSQALRSAAAGATHAVDVSGDELDLALSKIDWSVARDANDTQP